MLGPRHAAAQANTNQDHLYYDADLAYNQIKAMLGKSHQKPLNFTAPATT